MTRETHGSDPVLSAAACDSVKWLQASGRSTAACACLHELSKCIISIRRQMASSLTHGGNRICCCIKMPAAVYALVQQPSLCQIDLCILHRAFSLWSCLALRLCFVLVSVPACFMLRTIDVQHASARNFIMLHRWHMWCRPTRLGRRH